MNNPFTRAFRQLSAAPKPPAALNPPSEKQTPPPMDAAPPVEATLPDRNVTALLVGMYATMLAFAFAVYQAVSLGTGRSQEAPAACREDQANPCGEGKWCRSGECVPIEAPVCTEGAGCDSCLCEHPRSCGEDSLCKMPVMKPAVCNDELKGLVKQLIDFQKGCVAKAGGELSACPTANVKDFLLAHSTFDSLLKDFPGGLTIMFPSSQPMISQEEGAPWPDPATLKDYKTAVAAHADAFKDAKYIVLVGRASRGTAAADFGYAQARVRFARERLLDALAKTNVDRGEVSKKFIEFALGSEHPLQLEFFSMMYRHPTVWWDRNANRELESARAKLNANKKLSVVERSRSEQALNRSVVAFAIPQECVEG